MNFRSKIVAIIASTIFLGGGLSLGIWQATQPPGGGGGCGGCGNGISQDLYISTGGSDANPCTQLAPCRTMQQCYQTATEGNGDATHPSAICHMADGNYPTQTLLYSVHKPIGVYTCRWGGPFMTGNATAGNSGISVEPKDLSGCIEFVPLNAGQVNIDNLVVNTPYTYVEGMHIGNPAGGAHTSDFGAVEAENEPSHVSGTTCDNATFTDMILRDSTAYGMFLQGVEHWYDIHNTYDTGYSDAHSHIYGCSTNTGYGNNHIMIDGTTMKNQLWDSNGQHVEGVQWTGCETCTLQNSTFLNEGEYDISFAFGGATDNSGNHMLIQNNVFDDMCSHQFQGVGTDTTGCNGPGSGNNMINIGCPGGCSAQHWLFRFNSFYSDLPGGATDNWYGCDCAGGTTSDLLSEGNIGSGMGNGFRCGVRQGQGFTFDHEVYTVNPTCGTNNSYNNTAAAEYTNETNYDFTTKSCSTSPQVNFVPTSVTGGVPSTDINGNPRPAGTNADAGAYESCS